VTDIAAVVLAAGASHRFGADNKLLAMIDGRPMLTHVLDCVAALSLSRKIVVVRRDDGDVASLIDTQLFDIVENSNAADGMGSSVSAGISECGDVDGAMLTLGDMPFVQRATYLELLAAFHEHPDKTIVAPVYKGRRGHPVLIRRQHFADLEALDDDTGAKHIIAANAATFLAVPTEDAGVLQDVDTPVHDDW
jgi:molybdenum cofactor cytidylyltransferase